jgi:carboxylate-amine ligase
LEPHAVALHSEAAMAHIEHAAAHEGNHATWLRSQYANHGSVQAVVRAATDALRW